MFIARHTKLHLIVLKDNIVFSKKIDKKGTN